MLLVLMLLWYIAFKFEFVIDNIFSAYFQPIHIQPKFPKNYSALFLQIMVDSNSSLTFQAGNLKGKLNLNLFWRLTAF